MHQRQDSGEHRLVPLERFGVDAFAARTSASTR
jgi:hypothetical protein